MRIKDADMVVVLTHLSGGQAGQREVLDAAHIKLGRALDNDVIFTSQDLRASAHHAELFLDGDQFVVQDLESTNGTYLNGSRIQRATLRSGHIIQCGRKGPQLLFELKPRGEAAELLQKPWTKGTTISTTPRLLGEPASRRLTEPSRRFGRHTMQLMIEAAVRQSASSWRRLAAALAFLTLVALATLIYVTLIHPQPGPPAPVDSARVFSAIAQKNQSAVVFVQLNFKLVGRQGEILSQGTSEGTGFAIDARGYIATNDHIVRPWEFDERLQQLPATPVTISLTVIFADHNASDAIPATILHQSRKLDLAILAITPPPRMPLIQAFEPNIAHVHQGDEVAFIGFPYGSDLLNTTQQDRATTTFRRTTVSKVTKNLIQLDTEIQQGLSGSPIFNLEGKVIGIVAAEVQDQFEAKSLPIGLGIPIKQALELLAEG